MYYTHGDTVIFRSDRLERPPERRRRERDPGVRPSKPSPEQVLTARILQLEERLARLEAELEQARQAPPPRQGGQTRGRSGKGEQAVRVSLHAQGGAQATVGEVRLLQDD
ncbi:MAG: hypothetical protein ACOY93_04175 [Bacillota bacterium]